jgi:hypothetical protein
MQGRVMMTRLTAAALMVAAVIATVAVTSAGAATDTYTFQSCQGPVGTPSSFTAVKTSLPATAAHGVSGAIAYRLTNGSGVFIVIKFGDFYIAKGIAKNPQATTTCEVHFSSPDETLTLTGFFASATG